MRRKRCEKLERMLEQRARGELTTEQHRQSAIVLLQGAINQLAVGRDAQAGWRLAEAARHLDKAIGPMREPVLGLDVPTPSGVRLWTSADPAKRALFDSNPKAAPVDFEAFLANAREEVRKR